jgi:hypothetical protein
MRLHNPAGGAEPWDEVEDAADDRARAIARHFAALCMHSAKVRRRDRLVHEMNRKLDELVAAIFHVEVAQSDVAEAVAVVLSLEGPASLALQRQALELNAEQEIRDYVASRRSRAA